MTTHLFQAAPARSYQPATSNMPKRSPAARAPVSRPAGGGGRAPASHTNGISANAQAQIEDLNAQLMEMKLTVEGLEKERDFYFGKLRDVEVIAQEEENAPTSESTTFVQKVQLEAYIISFF